MAMLHDGRSGDVDDNASCHSNCTLGGSDWWDDVYEAADLTRTHFASVAYFAVHAKQSSQAVQALKIQTPEPKQQQEGGRKPYINACEAGPTSEDETAGDSMLTSNCNGKQGEVLSQTTTANETALSGLHLKDVMRVLYPSHYNILMYKVSLNHGLPHMNSVGKLKTGRQLRNPCYDKCKRCEIPKLSEVGRSTVFKMFSALGNHEKQWKFVSESVKVTKPLRREPGNSMPNKKSSRFYYFSFKGISRRVCKTMFKNTLCICDSWIDSALSHYRSNLPLIPDIRGRKRNAISTKPLPLQKNKLSDV